MLTALERGGQRFPLDEHGFLAAPELWSQGFAEAMADHLGMQLPLTPRHWECIDHLREVVRDQGAIPSVIATCLALGLRLATFRSLFPTGYFRGALRLAGLPYALIAGSNLWLTFETSPAVPARHALTPTGFLADFEAWDEDFARLMCSEVQPGQPLNAQRLRVLAYLRERYRTQHRVPTLFETCRDSGLRLSGFNDLFPSGYRRGACRIAGLPFLS